MRNLTRYTLSVGAVALLAGCGQALNGTQPTVGIPGVAHRILPASLYQVLYSFAQRSNGERPYAGLINVNGTLYGTTWSGGSSNKGAVYGISTTGQTKVLYSFKGGSDGAAPRASLINVNGTLYGTTYSGGGSECLHRDGCGTVYSITTAGSENVLYRFAGGSDGAYPWASLIFVKGTLYGTTLVGGKRGRDCHYGCGTIFSVTTGGAERVLYRFKGGTDGAIPESALIDVKDTLYGTTYSGGTYYCNFGCGTIFSTSTTGSEKMLYSFGGDPDGARPQSGLVEVKGTLYGTTSGGGNLCFPSSSCGTVFSVSTTGSEKVLHSFGSYPDGWNPQASLIDVNGTLYGTTEWGGSNYYGTVYSISTAGVEDVLYSFGNAPDGTFPVASMVNVNGILYGTTPWGGTGCSAGKIKGCGTVFTFSP